MLGVDEFLLYVQMVGLVSLDWWGGGHCVVLNRGCGGCSF